MKQVFKYKLGHKAEEDPQALSHLALQWAPRDVYIGNTLIPALEVAFGK